MKIWRMYNVWQHSCLVISYRYCTTKEIFGRSPHWLAPPCATHSILGNICDLTALSPMRRAENRFFSTWQPPMWLRAPVFWKPNRFSVGILGGWVAVDAADYPSATLMFNFPNERCSHVRTVQTIRMSVKLSSGIFIICIMQDGDHFDWCHFCRCTLGRYSFLSALREFAKF